MKAKFIIITAFSAILFLAFTAKSFSQDEMDFEEFMGMLSETFTDQQLDEMSYQLPDNIKVCGYAYGDFSNDGYYDIILSVREKGVTPANTVDVYILKSVGPTGYEVVEKRNYKCYDLLLEVAFMVKDGVCCITNRDDGNWYFSSYKIDENKNFVEVDKEAYPIEYEKAGN